MLDCLQVLLKWPRDPVLVSPSPQFTKRDSKTPLADAPAAFIPLFFRATRALWKNQPAMSGTFPPPEAPASCAQLCHFLFFFFVETVSLWPPVQMAFKDETITSRADSEFSFFSGKSFFFRRKRYWPPQTLFFSERPSPPQKKGEMSFSVQVFSLAARFVAW